MDARRIAKFVRARPGLIGLAAISVVLLVVLGGRALAPSSGFVIESAAEGEGSAAEASDGEGAEIEALTTVYVHVSGAVVAPGLYELPEDSRVAAAIEAAGGFAEDAATDGVNLARVVSDGEQIAVPTMEEQAASGSEATGAATGGSSLVNINTASASELDTLPDIGPSTAEKIIADREANGPFASIEDLKRVSGIGDKKYAQLESLICV